MLLLSIAIAYALLCDMVAQKGAQKGMPINSLFFQSILLTPIFGNYMINRYNGKSIMAIQSPPDKFDITVTRMVRLIAGVCIAMLIMEAHMDKATLESMVLKSTTMGFQWITHLFMHSGGAHLMSNLFGLLLFGPGLERKIGFTRTIIWFFIFGLAGSAAQMTLTNADGLIGASGAIFGITAAFAVLDESWMYIRGRKAIRMGILAIALIAMELEHLWDKDEIGHFAHIGGAAAGFIVAFIWKAFNKKKV